MTTLARLFALLLILVSTHLFAQRETSLLWKLSGEGIRDSYIFGTIHLLCPDDLELSDVLKERLASADQLVLELDFDDPSLMTDVQKYMIMDDQTLSDLFSEEEYESLSTFFEEKMGMPIAFMQKVKPFMLMSMMLPAALDCTPASYETSLVQLAKNNKQEVIGLETVEEQMTAIDAFPQEEMADMLIDYIENFEDTKDEFKSMVAAYKQQDPDALLAEMQEQLEESDSEEFNEVMLVKRNHAWIERIEKIAGEKSSFIAVGAGHLGGPEGIIALLREAGFEVEAISSQ